MCHVKDALVFIPSFPFFLSSSCLSPAIASLSIDLQSLSRRQFEYNSWKLSLIVDFIALFSRYSIISWHSCKQPYSYRPRKLVKIIIAMRHVEDALAIIPSFLFPLPIVCLSLTMACLSITVSLRFRMSLCNYFFLNSIKSHLCSFF